MSYKDILNIPSALAVTPAYTQQKFMDVLEAALNGELDVVDAGNPFMMLLEMASQGQAGAMINTDAKLRRFYRSLATGFADLYPHMSDADYIGRFATPGFISDGGVQLALEMNQIRDNSILDPVSNNSRIIIPQDTQYFAGDVYYYSHHPINIDTLADGNVIAYFDLNYNTPLSDRASNIIPAIRTFVDNTEFLLLTIPVEQIRCQSFSSPVDAATGWALTENISDQFYYARAYFTTDNVTWTEMVVTHDEQVHDASRPTMVMTVEGTQIGARIPDIYISGGQVGSNVRVDIFSTKGKEEIDLTGFDSDAWGLELNNFSGINSAYTNAMRNVTNRFITIFGSSRDGTDGLSFNALRNKVNYNLYGKDVPVTERELVEQLEEIGYGVANIKDTVLDRVFTASRVVDGSLTAPTSSGMGTTVDNVIIDPTRTDVSNSVSVNNDRVCIRPTAKYRFSSTGIAMVSDTDTAALEALTGEDLADAVNNENYFYTPLHYVLDNSTPNYHARAYYMDKPLVKNRSYLGNNAALGFIIATQSIALSRDSDNFKVNVVTNHPTLTNPALLQLTFVDKDNNRRHMTAVGTVVSPTQTDFEFIIETNMDIDSNSNVYATNVLDDGGVITPSFINLTLDCKFLYLSDTAAITAASFDAEVVRATYPTASAVSYEEASLQFANNLEGLFARSRSVLSAVEFERHTADVYEEYATDVYERDAGNDLIYTIVNNKPVFNKLHDAGDPILDGNGDPTVKYASGSIKTDAASGLPVVTKASVLHYELYMVLFDVSYLFATTSSTVAYRSAVMDNVLDYIEKDIVPYRPNMFERSELFYEPTSTIKSARVRLNGKRIQNYNTALGFTIDYLLERSSAGDNKLRASLTDSAKRIINTHLASGKVSIAGIGRDLQNGSSSEILDVTVSSPFGSATYAEMLDSNARFSIRARLQPQTNGLIDVTDDITINFTYED